MPSLKKINRALENLSIGMGYGIQNQMEGLYQMAAHPVQTGKGMAQLGQAVYKDPGLLGDLLKSEYQRGTSGLLGFGEVLGENLSPGMFRRNPRNLLDLTTYHGSPHRINNVTPDAPYGKFDLSKIGTGEGAQAYGHGIYLAESPDVAREYAKKGGQGIGSINRYSGQPLPDGAWDEIGPIMRKHDIPGDILPNQTEAGMVRGLLDDYGEALDYGERAVLEKYAAPPGHFYTVDLPDEHIAKMLDWDAPLSEQAWMPTESADEIIARVQREGRKPTEIEKAAVGLKRGALPDKSGHVFYKDIAQRLGSEKAASLALSESGIPGIRYFDGGSRAAGEGTRNFVIFDPEVAKILSRE